MNNMMVSTIVQRTSQQYVNNSTDLPDERLLETLPNLMPGDAGR